ncbi:MAG: hypothetical protein ACKVOS_03535 [Sphingorhabdus sp.]|uniref:hypothetical protein n=1 Tax=Sphingorhabdus sp. TaxID=1902408 RepID=UPI0038FC864C
MRDERQSRRWDDIENRRNGSNATDTAMEPQAFVVLPGVVILILDWHSMAI